MKPLCPRCRNEMSKAAKTRNMFNCEPCREIIQFFGAGMHVDIRRRIKPTWAAGRGIRHVRAA
jgi:tRNA(Ile2) C34 agmatinyltransferase TiaS